MQRSLTLRYHKSRMIHKARTSQGSGYERGHGSIRHERLPFVSKRRTRGEECGASPCGSQRYLCRACGHRWTPLPKRPGYPPEVRRARRAQELDSGSPTLVIMDEPAKDVAPLDATPLCTPCHRHRILLSQPLMRTPFIMESDIVPQHLPGVPLAQEQRVIQAFLSHGPHPALRAGVRIGCAEWSAHDLHILRHEDAVKRRTERGLPIVDELTRRHRTILDGPRPDCGPVVSPTPTSDGLYIRPDAPVGSPVR